MCSNHYSQWYRAQRRYAITCDWCGEAVMMGRKESRFCGRLCSNIAASRAAQSAPKVLAHRAKQAASKRAPMTAEEVEAWNLSLRSDLRAGYEDGNYEQFLKGLQERSAVTEQGCWEWLGQKKGPKGNEYPCVRFSGKQRQVHRLVIEAREGKPLGVLHAHHKCGNSICVSPEHLQPVTHRENVAEMLARNSLEARIAELEAALAIINPAHPALNRISHKSAA